MVNKVNISLKYFSVFLFTLDKLCEDAAYTIGLILLNEKAIEAKDANRKKSKIRLPL